MAKAKLIDSLVNPIKTDKVSSIVTAVTLFEVKRRSFQSIVESLIFLAVKTRWELSAAASMLVT